jgi:hypothetical protein
MLSFKWASSSLSVALYVSLQTGVYTYSQDKKAKNKKHDVLPVERDF